MPVAHARASSAAGDRTPARAQSRTAQIQSGGFRTRRRVRNGIFGMDSCRQAAWQEVEGHPESKSKEAKVIQSLSMSFLINRILQLVVPCDLTWQLRLAWETFSASKRSLPEVAANFSGCHL